MEHNDDIADFTYPLRVSFDRILKSLENDDDLLDRAKHIQELDKAVAQLRNDTAEMYRDVVVRLKESHSNAGLAKALGISVKRLFSIRDKATK